MINSLNLLNISPQSPPIRKIIHFDMDCFYAAVECKYNPQLRGLAIAIGGPPQSRSVISTASYEARKFGVRSAMPSSQAMRLCPQLKIVPHHFDLYKKESAAVLNILSQYSEKIEPLSLDEAFIDVSNSELFEGSATKLAHHIRKEVFQKTQLTISAGVSVNKFLAKIASDWNKPNGLKTITPTEIPEFMTQLPVEKIFGVGKVMVKKLHDLNIYTCGDLQNYSFIELQRRFGSWGYQLYHLARGIDERDVESDWERKSVGVEETYDHDLYSLDEIIESTSRLFKEWDQRMSQGQYHKKIKSIGIKIKFSDFKQVTREQHFSSIPNEINFSQLVIKFLKEYENENYKKKLQSQLSKGLRLIGIFSKLKTDSELNLETTQLNLFSGENNKVGL